jgi:hypothetical protein
MSTVVEISEARASSVRVTESELVVELEDGRTIMVPISWYPRLAYGTPQERSDFEMMGGGIGIHWPQLDEDISVEGLLTGRKAGEGAASLKRWKNKLDERRKTPNPGPWVEPKPLPDWWDEQA